MPVDCKPRKSDYYGIVIHHTGIGERDPDHVSDNLWRRLFKNIGNYLQRQDNIYVSAHYIVGRKGEVRELVDPVKYTAYHAGRSKFWHPARRKFVKYLNNWTVGIEIVGDGNRGEYSEEQYKAVGKLCKELMQRFETIEPYCIQGHEVISPGRKSDPGIYFDWRRLFRYIYS
jgi:AmpD protein